MNYSSGDVCPACKKGHLEFDIQKQTDDFDVLVCDHCYTPINRKSN